MFERVITQTIQTISQQVLGERPLIALGEILEEERIPYRFKPFFETEVHWWLHNESLARAANKRFDYENPEVASLVGYLEQVQFRHARFEREEFMAVLDSAVKLSYNYLCRPQITLKWYLFRGQPVKPLREVMLRFGAFVDYSYFFHVFSEWVDRKIQERPTFDAISATEFERIIRRVDDQILLSCTVEDLLAMMDPLFEFIGEGDDLIIPIDALIIFFDDKNINKLVEHLERIRERGMATVGREEFVGLLDELLTSADENPEQDFSNVYQNDELDDVVRMHLQSGPARTAESEATASAAPPVEEHPIRSNVTAETFTPLTTSPYQRATRPPVDQAMLDALDADDEEPARPTKVAQEPVWSAPISEDAPVREETQIQEETPVQERTPIQEETPVREETSTLATADLDDQPDPIDEPDEPEEIEPVVDEAPEPELDAIRTSDRPTPSWSADRSDEVNEEIEEWVEGLAEALGEWDDTPAEPASHLIGNSANPSPRADRRDEPASDEVDNIGHLLEDDDDDFIEASGISDVAPDDLFEADIEEEIDDHDDPLQEPAIFQIDDLEEEFEQEGPSDEEEPGSAVEAGQSAAGNDFSEARVAGILSDHENPFAQATPAAEREIVEPTSLDEDASVGSELRNGFVAQPAASTTTSGSGAAALEDVRRFIDAMLERKLVKKIFQRDRAAYDIALNQLNGAESWRAASQILDEIFIRYEIDPYSRTALRFTDSVYARYLPGKS